MAKRIRYAQSEDDDEGNAQYESRDTVLSLKDDQLPNSIHEQGQSSTGQYLLPEASRQQVKSRLLHGSSLPPIVNDETRAGERALNLKLG